MEHSSERITKGWSVVMGSILGLISWSSVTDLALVTAIGAIISGTMAFFVGKFWLWTWKKFVVSGFLEIYWGRLGIWFVSVLKKIFK